MHLPPDVPRRRRPRRVSAEHGAASGARCRLPADLVRPAGTHPPVFARRSVPGTEHRANVPGGSAAHDDGDGRVRPRHVGVRRDEPGVGPAVAFRGDTRVRLARLHDGDRRLPALFHARAVLHARQPRHALRPLRQRQREHARCIRCISDIPSSSADTASARSARTSASPVRREGRARFTTGCSDRACWWPISSCASRCCGRSVCGAGCTGRCPIEVAFFADGGVAWTDSQRPSFFGGDREPISSTGVSFRVNMFGFAVAQIDFAYPLQRPEPRLGVGVQPDAGILIPIAVFGIARICGASLSGSPREPGVRATRNQTC